MHIYREERKVGGRVGRRRKEGREEKDKEQREIEGENERQYGEREG